MIHQLFVRINFAIVSKLLVDKLLFTCIKKNFIKNYKTCALLALSSVCFTNLKINLLIILRDRICLYKYLLNIYLF